MSEMEEKEQLFIARSARQRELEEELLQLYKEDEDDRKEIPPLAKGEGKLSQEVKKVIEIAAYHALQRGSNQVQLRDVKQAVEDLEK